MVFSSCIFSLEYLSFFFFLEAHLSGRNIMAAVSSELRKCLREFPVLHESVLLIPSTSFSPNVDRLKRSLQIHDLNSTITKLFKMVVMKVRLNEENFLPWKDMYYAGSTGYIDGISAKDLKHPVMWGIDPKGRPFVSFRYKHSYSDKSINEEGYESLTFFQRYCESGNCVPSAGGNTKLLPINFNTFVSGFEKLLSGETIEHKEDMWISSSKEDASIASQFPVKRFSLMTERDDLTAMKCSESFCCFRITDK